MIGILMYYTLYNVRLSKIVAKLPIPKRWKVRFIMWQFHGLAMFALSKMWAATAGKP